MKHGTFAMVPLAIWLVSPVAVSATGCSTAGPDGGMGKVDTEKARPAMNTTDTQTPAGDPILALQGTVASIGGCRCGIASVGADEAQIDTLSAPPGAIAVTGTQRVRVGQLLVACGALHRVLAFQTPGGSNLPGGSGRLVVIDPTPETRISLSPRSLVLTVGGSLSAPGAFELRDLVISETAGRPVAGFRALSLVADATAIEVTAGASFTAGPGKWRVIDVKAPDAQLGIPGWVEFESAPGT